MRLRTIVATAALEADGTVAVVVAAVVAARAVGELQPQKGVEIVSAAEVAVIAVEVAVASPREGPVALASEPTAAAAMTEQIRRRHFERQKRQQG